MATTKSKKAPRLTLHQLIGALSFWGSSVRLLLAAFLIGVILVLRLVYLQTSFEPEIKAVIYVFGTLALLDIGYVMLARAFPLRRALDLLCLLVLDAVLVLAYVLPNLVNLRMFEALSMWAVILVLLVLSLRGLVGLLFTKRRS